jgi:hypothetical protein
VLIIRKSNCINAACGIVTLCRWPSGAQVERGLVGMHLSTGALDGHLQSVTIPDAALIHHLMS